MEGQTEIGRSSLTQKYIGKAKPSKGIIGTAKPRSASATTCLLVSRGAVGPRAALICASRDLACVLKHALQIAEHSDDGSHIGPLKTVLGRVRARAQELGLGQSANAKQKAQDVVLNTIPKIKAFAGKHPMHDAMNNAIMTAPDFMPAHRVVALAPLLKKYVKIPSASELIPWGKIAAAAGVFAVGYTMFIRK